MDVKELRIGNWIQSETEVFGEKKFRQWQVEIEDLEYIESNPEDYFGIPITEDWLLKAGFNTTPLGYKINIGDKRELTLSLCNDKGKGEYYFYVRDNEDFTGFSIRIFYLHQLQNLYFALTNKELEIKLS